MNSSRVHFYVDDTGAWQNLRAGTGLCSSDQVGTAEVSWHSGDGSVADGGNMTSISIEIIMGESTEHDAIAKDNVARIAAWLLWKNGLSIDKLVTHTYWVNKSAGKTFSDVDTQCTNPISGKKWCPSYIFNSNNAATAKKNWLAFKELVKGYLDKLNGGVGVEGYTYTAIAGSAKATTGQMRAYIKAKNPAVPQSVLDMVSLYLSEGAAEGIRGDVAFAQSCLETGNFAFAGSAVTLDQNNFCGMGVTENGVKGNSFATAQLGIRAQIQHLKAYANTAALNGECVDPRFSYVTRGCAEYVEWLGQKENPNGKGWATGAGYGEKILSILKAILAITETETEEEEMRYPIPAISFFAASNEIPNFNDPQEKILEALYDRLELKVVTDNIADRDKRLAVLADKQAGRADYRVHHAGRAGADAAAGGGHSGTRRGK